MQPTLPNGIAIKVVDFALRYRIVIGEPSAGEIAARANALGGMVGRGPWTADFWFGALDADALRASLRELLARACISWKTG